MTLTTVARTVLTALFVVTLAVEPGRADESKEQTKNPNKDSPGYFFPVSGAKDCAFDQARERLCRRTPEGSARAAEDAGHGGSEVGAASRAAPPVRPARLAGPTHGLVVRPRGYVVWPHAGVSPCASFVTDSGRGS
jgi:hypothetical protein